MVLSSLNHSSPLCVVPGGFEPPLREPKTLVLPLHHRTILVFKATAFLETLPTEIRCKDKYIFFN